MNIGQLKSRIKIYKRTFSVDEDLGTDESSEVLLCELWANISPRTGSMLTGRDAGTILSQTTHAITIRSRGDITPDCYILWNDEFGSEHKFTIDYIRPPVGDNYMLMYVTEQI